MNHTEAILNKILSAAIFGDCLSKNSIVCLLASMKAKIF